MHPPGSDVYIAPTDTIRSLETIMKSTLLAPTLLLSALIFWHAPSAAQSTGTIPENLDSIIVAGYQANNLPGIHSEPQALAP
jgi:hypothetical protein